MSSRFKQVGALIVASVAVSACLAPAGAQATTGVPKDPILFVHGFGGNPTNWTSFKAKLSADGYDTGGRTLEAWYGLVEPMALSAANVGVMVQALKIKTGASKVDIVTHSYGGPASRYYLKKLLGTGNVDEWVSIGGPNKAYKGAPCWLFGFPTPLALVPGNACYDLNPNKPTMKFLNGGDQTPGSVRYLTVRSPADEVVNNAWTPLSGAQNVTTTQRPSHSGMIIGDTPGSREVYNIVKGFLD